MKNIILKCKKICRFSEKNSKISKKSNYSLIFCIKMNFKMAMVKFQNAIKIKQRTKNFKKIKKNSKKNHFKMINKYVKIF